MPQRSVAWIVFAFLTAFIGLFLFLAWFAAFDDGGIRRGDLAYFVFIPAIVRDLSSPSACGETHYASRTNDSLEAEVISMEFETRSELGDLVAAYDRELGPWSCSRLAPLLRGRPIVFRCSKPDVEVTLETGEADNAACRPATLAFRFGPFSR